MFSKNGMLLRVGLKKKKKNTRRGGNFSECFIKAWLKNKLNKFLYKAFLRTSHILMRLMKPQEWYVICSFPQTLFDHGALSIETDILWATLLKNSELAGFGRIFRDLCADKCILHSESPGLDVKGRSLPSHQPGSSAHQESLSFCCNYYDEEGTSWPRLTLKNGAIPCTCLSHHPLHSSACPLPSIQGICLVKLINLFNDAISFFHINLGPENSPLSVLPRRRAFSHACALSGMGTCLGEHQGAVLWISWISRMTLLMHIGDILVPWRWIQC